MTRPTVLIGLIGTDIQSSAAPEVHMVEGENLGFRYIYRLIDLTALKLGVEALPDLVASAERLGFTGLCITHPCKQAVIPLLTDLSEHAQALGAVNTVILRDGRRIGHNTDWIGFAEAFRRNLGDLPRRRVVQLGAGGAGVAVAYAGLELGYGEITLFDPDPGRLGAAMERLSARFGADRVHAGRDLEAALAAADGLVNATAVGMAGHPGIPLSPTLLRADLWVSDVIYVPDETELLRAARALGARTDNGAGMNIYQAVEQVRLFTGQEPDPVRMRRSFDATLSLRKG